MNCGGAVNTAVMPMKWRRPNRCSAVGSDEQHATVLVDESLLDQVPQRSVRRCGRTGRGRSTQSGHRWSPIRCSCRQRASRLLGDDVPGLGRRHHRLDVAAAPQVQQPGGVQQRACSGRGTGSCGACRHAGRCGRAVAGTRRRSRRVDLDDAVQVADVDAELQGGGGHDDAVAGLGEGLPRHGAARRRTATRGTGTWSHRVRAAAAPSSSTSCRESQKTSRFSPRCSAAMTFAALLTDPT